ncbi:hypothetical protein EB75_05410 [Mycobacterium sp. ST-F2]|nr:hypothetical protein EB75_05410 [Mycobacterium sp. ST-F2]
MVGQRFVGRRGGADHRSTGEGQGRRDVSHPAAARGQRDRSGCPHYGLHELGPPNVSLCVRSRPDRTHKLSLGAEN